MKPGDIYCMRRKSQGEKYVQRISWIKCLHIAIPIDFKLFVVKFIVVSMKTMYKIIYA